MKRSLEKLLEESKGFPKSSSIITSLQPIPEQSTHETACGAVYWIKSPSPSWLKEQSFFPFLTCEPHKNSLAPGKPKSFSISYCNSSKPEWIGLPRFLGISLFGQPKKDVRSMGLDLLSSFSDSRSLREYQTTALENSLKSLKTWGGATIIADCGAGKTCMALSIAISLKRKTLVLCNRTFLMHQWKNEICGKGWTWASDHSKAEEGLFRIKCTSCKKKHETREKFPICSCGFRFIGLWDFPLPPAPGWTENSRVGWLQGSNVIDTKDKDFVVASIDSLSQCAYDSEILKEFGLVIIDEMHHLGSLTLSQVLPKIPARYILGISATPDRSDGLEHVLYWLAGPTSFVYKRLPSITGLKETVEVNMIKFNGGERKELYNYGKIAFASMTTSLAKDDARNDFLLETVSKFLSERKKILIVTSIVEHAKFLGQKLDALVIHGGCSSSLVSQAKFRETKVVCATYQFLEEGYDDPYIDTLVMALPRSRIQQVVGRCERTHEGKLVPLVIDFIDTFSIYEAMSWKRNAFYKSRGFKINRM